MENPQRINDNLLSFLQLVINEINYCLKMAIKSWYDVVHQIICKCFIYLFLFFRELIKWESKSKVKKPAH